MQMTVQRGYVQVGVIAWGHLQGRWISGMSPPVGFGNTGGRPSGGCREAIGLGNIVAGMAGNGIGLKASPADAKSRHISP